VTSPDDCNSYAYGYWYGTSLASPHVAGCVALIHSLFPSKSDNQVRDYLYNSCTVDLGASGKDNIYGWGKVELPFVMVNTKVWLEGPYSGGSMSTALNTAGVIPLSQPYNTAPWNYAGTESVGSIPSGVVDWILVQLRSDTTTVATRAAFVRSDGSVVDVDGASQVAFSGVAAGDYYVVIRHRNHLAIMSASAVPLSASSALYDFTTNQNQAYGTSPMILVGSSYAMYAGDGNETGIVTAADANAIFGVLNTSGYNANDVNLSGIVTAADANIVFGNINKSTQVP
jgi:hypothetical protein